MSSPPPPSTTTTTDLPPPPPPPPPPRKFPAPCWTQEETLALISAYQDKWYSLRRRNLRTADWESVAFDVTTRCPNQSPPKTSAQCRHKMEKLRKRYRTEKQRFLSLPHNPNFNPRFFSPSSWMFFDLMEAMEAGSNSNPNSNSNPQETLNPPMGLPIRMVNDIGKPDLVEKSSNLKGNKHEFGKYFEEILLGMPGGVGVGVGSVGVGGGGVGGGGGVAAATPIKFKFKHQYDHHHYVNRFVDSNHDDDDDDDNEYYDGNDFRKGGGRPGSNKRKFSTTQEYDDRYGFDPDLPRKMMNGGGSKSGSGSRSRDSLAEMVASIKMLGEGLVKMEKMKMDMMREIEKMRMEMEMKRSEMILESQQLIVNAFVEGLKKNNNNKVKVMEVE